MNELMYLSDVVTLELCQATCNGCGMCYKVCPHSVFKISEGKARIVRKDYCMECGACQMNCPTGAIKVNSGVGCAAGILRGVLTDSKPSCSCSG